MDIVGKYEDKTEIKDEPSLWERWVAEIEAAKRASEKYTTLCTNILNIYSSKSNDGSYKIESSPTRYNILWSNCEVIKPATYSREPQAIISRRHSGKDAVARVAALLMERCHKYNNEEIEVQHTFLEIRDDFVLFARGLPWCRFCPYFVPMVNPMTGEPVIDEQTGQPAEQIQSALCHVDHVNYKDFLLSPCREWSECRWVCRLAYMTREALIARFGEEKGRACKLTYSPKSEDREKEKYDAIFARAEVYEVWDKESRRVFWLSPKGLEESFLDVKDDPLHLKNFFPCPRPAFGTLGDSLIPTPDYVLYRDLARDLSIIWQRVTHLEAAMKWGGVFNAEFAVLGQLLNGEEARFFPVENWVGFLQTAGGVNGGVQFMPYAQIVEVIARLYDAARQKEEAIYKIIGISDIMRGYNDPRETATATRTKGEVAGLRIRDKQSEFSRMVRDVYEIQVEVIAEWFPEELIYQMAAADELSETDQQLVPQAMQMIKNDMLRNFRIEVETDSTVELDRNQEKQNRLEFATTVVDAVKNMMPMAMQMPATTPFIVDTISYVAQGMGAGRELEGSIDSMLQGLTEQQRQQMEQQQQQQQMEQQQAQQNQDAIQAQKATGRFSAANPESAVRD